MALYIVGAGGVGRETLDAIIASGSDAAAFLDDGLVGRVVRGLSVLRPDDAPRGEAYVVGIAAPGHRRRLAAQLDARGMHPQTVRHPRAVVAPDTIIGEGTVVLAGAHISSSITIGMHGQVHYNATVGHDTVFGDFVSVYPGANVSGSVRLGDGATVGSGAVVLQGLAIGSTAFVGAGAVVTRDVPPGAVVVGSPARPLEQQHGA